MRDVTLIGADQRSRLDTTQTPGMVREQAIAVAGLWAGTIRTEPGMRSGWHHHGDHETSIYVLSGKMRLEFGPGGAKVAEASPGDFLHVPAHAIHRESNPTDVPAEAVVVRAGRGEVVFNVDGPA